MIKNLLITYLFLITNVFAGLPPTTMRGQSQTLKPTTFNFQVPNKQATITAASTSLIETGNNNELENRGFEHTAVTTGWTISNATPSSSTTRIEGSKSLSLALTGALSLSQSSTINADQKSGVQMVASIWVNSSDVSDLQLCSLKNGAEDKCTVAGGYVQGSGWRQLTVSFLGNSTSNGLKLKSTDTTGTVLVDQAYVGIGSPVVDFTPDMVYTAEVKTTTGVVTKENIDFIASCTAANPTVCTFNSGIFTTAPNCTLGSDNWAHNITNVTATGFNLFSFNTTTAAALGSISAFVTCVKTGADYKTSKAYVASGSVALNTTEFGAYVSSTGTVSQENTDWLTTCSWASGTLTCNFVSSKFTTAPNCWGSSTAQGQRASISSVSTSQVVLTNRANDGTGNVGSNIYLYCQKTGADYQAAFNPVIVGSFQGYNSTPGSSSPKIYSAEISGTGSVSKEFGDLINGNCTSATPSVCTFTANKFSSEPNCSISVVGVTTNRSASFQAISSTSFSFNVNQNSGGVALMDFPVKVICHGE